ncbi:DUF3180 domain-containing protein [Corynebacterium ulceribovis]|uniref:DUF3180 domain-containing protein n=1 Tax=Corynebacterium ulceribovis TaxID=487732 RepID=UPI0004764AEA|nr:DUF3180 domain-containing protein [Corynebacterium ulceribovis]
MQRTNPRAPIALALGVGVVTVLLAWRFYGSLPGLHARDTAFLWFLAVMCGLAAWWVKKRVSDGDIGQDRSQVNPTTVAGLLIIGDAAIWLGAIFAGLYGGLAVWVLPRTGELLAAEEEAPVVILGLVASVLVTIAGLVLEWACSVPPDDDEGRGLGSGIEATPA